MLHLRARPFADVTHRGCWVVTKDYYIGVAIFLTGGPVVPILPPPIGVSRKSKERVMKVSNSLKALKKRHANCKVVRRKGRTYVINKTNPRFKARQG